MKKITVFSFVLILIVFFISNCKTVQAKKKENFRDSEDIEVWMLNAQNNTTRRKYNDAINVLSEILVKFPDEEVLAVNYNIGYNYYKLRKYDDATSYLNRVISFFENNEIVTYDIQDSRKFVILAGLVLDRIENDKIYRKDPYHVTDDIKEFRKNRPKRPNTTE